MSCEEELPWKEGSTLFNFISSVQVDNDLSYQGSMKIEDFVYEQSVQVVNGNDLSHIPVFHKDAKSVLNSTDANFAQKINTKTTITKRGISAHIHCSLDSGMSNGETGTLKGVLLRIKKPHRRIMFCKIYFKSYFIMFAI